MHMGSLACLELDYYLRQVYHTLCQTTPTNARKSVLSHFLGNEFGMPGQVLSVLFVLSTLAETREVVTIPNEKAALDADHTFAVADFAYLRAAIDESHVVKQKFRFDTVHTHLPSCTLVMMTVVYTRKADIRTDRAKVLDICHTRTIPHQHSASTSDAIQD